MFSVAQKRAIADAVQKVLRDTNHPELPAAGVSEPESKGAMQAMRLVGAYRAANGGVEIAVAHGKREKVARIPLTRAQSIYLIKEIAEAMHMSERQ